MFDPLRSMLVKEFIQVLRDPKMRFIVFVAPIFQLLVFGYAAVTDVRHVATAVMDLDHSVQSRAIVERLEHSGYFDVVAYPSTDAQARSLLDRGAAETLVRFDAGFGAQMVAGQTPAIGLIADGADSTTVQSALGYATKILQQAALDQAVDTARRLTGRAPTVKLVDLQARPWFNEDLSSRNFYLPGIAGSLVTLLTLILTAMAVVREREVGTMEQIMVTPIRPVEFIIGKTIPFALIGLIDASLVLLLSVGWFHVPMRGNLFFLYGCVVLALITTLSIGLLLSTVSATQQQAMMGAFMFLLPAIMLSGFMFPIANMPAVVQWFTYFDPLRYLIEILRGVLLKGIGFDILWPQCLALTLLGLASATLAVSRFRKIAS